MALVEIVVSIMSFLAIMAGFFGVFLHMSRNHIERFLAQKKYTYSLRFVSIEYIRGYRSIAEKVFFCYSAVSLDEALIVKANYAGKIKAISVEKT